jgi:hypothetical protein
VIRAFPVESRGPGFRCGTPVARCGAPPAPWTAETSAFVWALQISNLGPPPCKGGEEEASNSNDSDSPGQTAKAINCVAMGLDLSSHGFCGTHVARHRARERQARRATRVAIVAAVLAFTLRPSPAFLEPGHGRADRLRKWPSSPPKGPLELAAVDDPRPLGLVELLSYRPECRVEQARQGKAPPRCRPKARRTADLREHHFHESGHGHCLVVRDVPHTTQGLLPLPERHQRPSEVVDVGDRVGDIGIAQYLGGPPGEGPGEDPVAQGGLMGMGTEEVRPPPDGRPDPAGLVRRHQGLRDQRPGPAVGP